MNVQNAITEGHRRLMAELRSLGPPSAILDAFDEVPRHWFLPGVPLDEVFRDRSVTTVREAGVAVSSCSQPSWVARCIGHAGVATGQRILEIGSGTGYSAAILARVVGPSGAVVTVDIDQKLVDTTRKNLAAFGFDREAEGLRGGRERPDPTPKSQEHASGQVAPRHESIPVPLSSEGERFHKSGFGTITTRCQDGFVPVPVEPVYHAIMVTATCTDIAPCWHHQLAEGGHLVLPLRLFPGVIVLVAFVKRADGLLSRHIELSKAVALRGEGAQEPSSWRELQLRAVLNDDPDAADQSILSRRHNQFVIAPTNSPRHQRG